MMKMKHFLGLVGIGLVLLTAACSKDDKESFDAAKQAAIDEDRIKHYIDTANITGTVRDSTGLYYKIITPGTGTDTMKLTSKMSIIYRGTLLNGTQFDSSADTATTLRGAMLMNLIQGWQIGLRKVTKGGEIQLFVPSALGYKQQNLGTIPPNSVLVFKVKLVDVYLN